MTISVALPPGVKMIEPNVLRCFQWHQNQHIHGHPQVLIGPTATLKRYSMALSIAVHSLVAAHRPIDTGM